MKTLSLGYSPCPNDTFIFYAMINGKIDTGNLKFNELLLDVETLNQKALNSSLDISKVSYHAYGHLRDKYRLLRAGGALGRKCGPLLITKNDYSMSQLRGRKIAVPGQLTTAYLLLQLYCASFDFQPSSPLFMPFNEIIDAVASGKADAGLIIHESRFTYQSFGLKQIIDLGEWWEGETSLPIPLGGIIAKRSLGDGLINTINTVVKNSVEYAFSNRVEPMNYIKEHSQELSDDVIKQHIDLYVNDFSIDIGKEGEKAVVELFSRSEKAGLIPNTNLKSFM